MHAAAARLWLVRWLVVVVVVLAAGCASSSSDTSPVAIEPNTTAAAAAPGAPSTASAPTTSAPLWVVGASTLPRRKDGFGVVSPTPPVLVDRRLPTVDRLPPPADGRFASSVGPTSEAQLAGSWKEGCPIPIADLRYVTVSFWGFDEKAHTGELVVHARHADGLVGVFRQLFDARFPIEEMRLVTGDDLEAPPTGDGNNTAAFACRPARGSSRFSTHAEGAAIDLNPFQNPYKRGDLVLPELASAYLDRANKRPGMLFRDDVAVRAFASIGWSWGGLWTNPVDTMHFSATGR